MIAAFRVLAHACDAHLAMTRSEREEALDAGRFFHGGIPGLEPGDAILPAAEVGILQSGAPLVPERRRRVYVTVNPEYAEVYARCWPGGGSV